MVAARMAALKACLPAGAYARMYADASILIGHYGRKNAAWVDASDPKAPANDGGRGIRSWQAHFDYATAATDNTPGTLVGDRLRALAAVRNSGIDKLYGDVSILLANYGRMN